MIIKKIKADEFGKLSSYQSPELSDKITVFFGKNEAGKSTILNIVMTLLYGFNPASRETNPYVSWKKDQASCAGEFVLDNKKDIIVSRQLRSRAEGKAEQDSKIRIINNNSVEFTGNISREIFSEVFTITQDKLGIPDDKLWQKLQEQLLGGQYKSFIRPVSLVCSELDSEASSLWKDDNRGKPRDKELTIRIKELNTKLIAARENEKRVYDTREELEKTELEIDNLKKKRYDYIICLDKIERLVPAARKLKSIETMKTQAGDIEKFNSIPEKPLNIIESYEDDIDNINKKLQILQNKRESQVSVINENNPICKKVFNIKDKISTVIKTQGLVISCIESIKSLQREKESILAKFHADFDSLLKGGFSKDLILKVKSIDNIELKESIDSYKADMRKITEQEAKNAAFNIKLEGNQKSKAIAYISVITIVSGLIALFTFKTSEYKFTGGIFTALGFVFLMYYFFIGSNRASQIELKEGEKLLKKYSQQSLESVNEVKIALRDIPFGNMRMNNPDDTLLVDIREIKNMILRNDSIEEQLQKEINDLKSFEEKISTIFAALDIEPTNSIISNIDKLEFILGDALNKSREYDAALIQIKQIDADLLNYKKEIGDLEYRKHQITDLLSNVEGESLLERIQTLEKRRKTMVKALALEEELMSNPEEFNLVKQQIKVAIDSGDKWIYSDEDAVNIKLKKEEIDSQLEEKIEKSGSLRSTLEELKNLNRLDDIIGEIKSCETQKKEIGFKRDKLILLKNIILEADRRFKDEHQPDVIYRAGKYLKIITSGKYDKIYSTDDNGAGLLIRCSSDGSIISAQHPLSLGTLEQIYFCLRIALLDHLDSFSEKLPLFMDEAFINWDSTRMGEGIKVLKEIAQKRQIIIFTCHGWFKDLIKKETDCTIIDML